LWLPPRFEVIVNWTNGSHMLGFITPDFLPICLMIMAASAIFHTLICVGVVYRQVLNWLRC